MTLAGLPSTRELLTHMVEARLPPAARAWWSTSRAATTAFDEAAFLVQFAGASRLVGRAPLSCTADEIAALTRAGIGWPVAASADELARVTLLLGAPLDAEGQAALAAEAYRRGDNRERQAVLRALPLLPFVPALLTLAVEACRTNVVPLFAAIACENPFPSERFPELNFNQMVLKAVFVGLALERVLDLERRLTPELTRVAEDYAKERIAAGRSVPADLRLLGVKVLHEAI